MKILEKVWGGLGLLEPVEAEEEHVRGEDSEQRGKKSVNLVNLPTNPKQMKVIVVEPLSFDDAQQVSDHLKNRKPVVVNFENTDKDIAKRMIDFISGTTYALGGSIQKIGTHIFLCAPNNVDVAYTPREEAVNKEFLPWANK